MFQIIFGQILIIIYFINLTFQNDIIGFYQDFNQNTKDYSWSPCNPNCYTCNTGSVGGNNNCLSCNSKNGFFLLDDDINQNCYTREDLSPLDPNNEYILDTKQVPNKWVKCHDNCKTCSGKETLPERMNCIECKDGFIKVNTFCYPYNTMDTKLGFYVNGVTKYCGQFTDDETGQQLGIFSGGDRCIIKPDSSYFPKNEPTEMLMPCGNNCIICDGDINNATNSICVKCKENFVFYPGSNDCFCPKYYGIESNTNNCVNCKYSAEGPYNRDGQCVSTKEASEKIINTTYNILSKCDRPCLTCDASTKRCKTCAPNYYLNQIALDNISIVDNYEICLSYKECLYLGIGADIYFSECNFCSGNKYKLYNGTSCDQILESTEGYYYLKNENYNAINPCHELCATCSGMPKGDKFQYCTSCKNNDSYILDDEDNCVLEIVEEEMEEEEEEEEEFKCKDMLFYIDIEEEDEDEKFKCITGDSICPFDYPYLVQSYMMCVKDLPYHIISNEKGYVVNITYDEEYNNRTKEQKFFDIIKINNWETPAIIHFSGNKNYLEDYWTFLDEKIKKSKLKYRPTLRYLDDIDYVYDVYDNPNNHNGNLYIHSEDSTFHFTIMDKEDNFIIASTKNVKNNNFLFYANSNHIPRSYGFTNMYKYETYRNSRRISIIYLAECGKIIGKIMDIANINEDLLLLKLDIYKNITTNEITTSKVVYRLYDKNNVNEHIDLSICKHYPINIITPVTISEQINSENNKLYKILLHVKKAGFEPFIVYSDFYTKICNQYYSERGTDMNMKDRKELIYDKIKKFNFCQKNCYYRSTDDNIYFINCICTPQNFNESEEQTFDISDSEFTTLEENNEDNYKNVDQNKLLEDINTNTVNDYFNFYLMKCFTLLFSYDGFFYNYISMIIIGIYILYLFLIFFYSCIGFDFYITLLKEMLFHKFLYREFWRIKKINEEINSEEDNISFDDKKENEINIIDRKIQNRTNTKNVYERVKKFNPKEDNKWIRLNKSSILVDPIKDDQIQAVNKYEYKDNEIYKNKNNFIRDYQNDTNLNKNAAPPKKLDKKNNNYYHMEKNHDLINSRTVKPITSSNYDDIQALVKGKQKSEEQIEETNENNAIDIDKGIDIAYKEVENQNDTIEEVDKEKEKDNKEDINPEKEGELIEQKKPIATQEMETNLFNKKSELHNTSPAIYIYNLILGDYQKDMIEEENDEKEISNIITKREYSFLNDGEINELDYDNGLFHDKRNIVRIYYSYLKYNCVLIFSFFVYEDFNLMLVKYALFLNYGILYLTFNAVFFNNNTIHNIYINEGTYVVEYHAWKIFLAFIFSLIFIKLIKWWITFYRRKSLYMKLLKRYTDAKNEILRMIEQYHFHLKIYYPVSCVVIILFWYYISCIFAVFRYSYWHLLLNWAICAIFHVAYSIVMNIIPTVLRYISLRKDGRSCLYTASRIISYFC